MKNEWKMKKHNFKVGDLVKLNTSRIEASLPLRWTRDLKPHFNDIGEVVKVDSTVTIKWNTFPETRVAPSFLIKLTPIEYMKHKYKEKDSV